MKRYLFDKFVMVLALLLVAVTLFIMPSWVAISAGATIWPSTATPAVVADPDTGAVELGVKFRADSSGTITGIRFYKSSTNTGTHVGNLWSSTGTLLATATFTNETASGWQQVNFSTPVAIAANTVYVASYHTNVGHYSCDEGYFSGTSVDNPPLHALADGVSGYNGAYAYGSSSAFPNQGWNGSNYWVDVVFSPTGGADTSAPNVTAFTVPATASTLIVPITSFTATDNVGVTGYVVTESSSVPSASAGGWSGTAQTSYTFTTAGTKTLYAWAKDAAGNVSISMSASVIITLSDTSAPNVTAFAIPATASTLTVSITSFTAQDNVLVTGYMVTESSSAPSASAGGWTSTAPGSYTFATAGSKTLYAWAKDAANNVSTSRSASVTITLPADTTRPVVTFTLPAAASTLTVTFVQFTATDNVGVTGYMVKTSSTNPTANSTGWVTPAPISYTFTSAGTKTLYAWAKDAAGNVSARKSASVTITLQSGGPEPAGWYAGDMHVHRSCGGSPESVSSLYNKMSTQDLAVISLLADMGNGEVLDPVTDLPKVTGADDPISTPGRIVHWDAEWHWDPGYYQFPHQALGGHVVALGLSDAYQIWEEYTYPIFNWAHQQNGIAGFVHMQYLDGGIPGDLNCCIPIEYPVEVALGAADFISEDVNGSDAAIEAYYKLLNCGFRPSLTAGTDYPCGVSELGSLLTYVQVAGGQMTYDNWINGIALGRTVISRNGHNEFLALKVNSTSTPGDQINLTGAGSVQVTVTWTAKQSLSGSIELVHNGIVVASQGASVSQGAPATLSTSVSFEKSGWLAARRMSGGGHEVHTGAVFVIVNNAPIRASESDALFHVDWIDNLLEKTSPGGAWAGYFSSSTTRDAAQARYRAAKAIYEQIATEANGTPPPGDTSAPTVTAFTIPATASTLTVAITSFTATDNALVTGYMVTESSTTPLATANGWSGTAPTSYTFGTAGTKTLYAWAKDAAGNVSASMSASVTITLPGGPPLPPVAAYGFEEDLGSVAYDSSTNGNNGAISGASWSGAGRFGKALSFDGVNDRVDIPDNPTLDLTSAMTLEAWVNPTALSGWRTVILKETSNGLAYSLYAHDNAPRPAAYVNTGGGDISAVGNQGLPLNTWTHLAATYDGSILRIFVNGNEVGSRTVGEAIIVSNGALRIGGNAIWGEYFSGLIDEVRIYNRALTQSEIQADMSTPVAGP